MNSFRFQKSFAMSALSLLASAALIHVASAEPAQNKKPRGTTVPVIVKPSLNAANSAQNVSSGASGSVNAGRSSIAGFNAKPGDAAKTKGRSTGQSYNGGLTPGYGYPDYDDSNVIDNSGNTTVANTNPYAYGYPAGYGYPYGYGYGYPGGYGYPYGYNYGYGYGYPYGYITPPPPTFRTLPGGLVRQYSSGYSPDIDYNYGNGYYVAAPYSYYGTPYYGASYYGYDNGYYGSYYGSYSTRSDGVGVNATIDLGGKSRANVSIGSSNSSGAGNAYFPPFGNQMPYSPGGMRTNPAANTPPSWGNFPSRNTSTGSIRMPGMGVPSLGMSGAATPGMGMPGVGMSGMGMPGMGMPSMAVPPLPAAKR